MRDQNESENAMDEGPGLALSPWFWSTGVFSLALWGCIGWLAFR